MAVKGIPPDRKTSAFRVFSSRTYLRKRVEEIMTFTRRCSTLALTHLQSRLPRARAPAGAPWFQAKHCCCCGGRPSRPLTTGDESPACVTVALAQLGQRGPMVQSGSPVYDGGTPSNADGQPTSPRFERAREGPRSTATGIRTPVSAVRGRRPSPLDDSGASNAVTVAKGWPPTGLGVAPPSTPNPGQTMGPPRMGATAAGTAGR
jgi:hypothetical protein